MTKRVWRYELDIGRSTALELPSGAQVLHVGYKEDRPAAQLWALVEDTAALETRRFQVVGTDWAIDLPNMQHVGTCVLSGGFYVWHVFEYTP